MAQPSAAFAVVVDASAEEAVYAQVARQLREAIASGTLAPGTQLPSVRAVASDLGVNLNTIARAYRLLEDEGFVAIESRAGARVVAPGTHGSLEMRQRLTEDLRTLLWRMRQAGFGPRELRRLALRQIASVAAPPRS